jgi:hypothetical protein
VFNDGNPECECGSVDETALQVAIAEIRAQWEAWFESGRLPPVCERCKKGKLWKNGVYTRAVSLWVQGVVVYFAAVRGRRVKCASCQAGYRIRPDNIVPYKHYQPCVVASALNQCVLAQTPRSIPQVAKSHDCSRWTVARWIDWVACLADPGQLLSKVHEASDAPVVVKLRGPVERLRQGHLPTLPTDKDLDAGSAGQLLNAVRVVCGAVLSLMEVLTSALDLEPPGLRAILKRFVSNRTCVATYRRPVIPELARSQPP